MPQPRKISTDKRDNQITKINDILVAQAGKLDTIIADLSKPHVDDKATAKTLLATAKKMRKALPSA